MARASRCSDFILAACVAAAAVIVSPLGIELAIGRADLSLRVTAISLTFAGFLAIFAAAVLAQRWLRRALLYLLAGVFPLAVLAALEAIAVSVHLADVVAPLEDTSLLANKTPWPTYLLTDSSYYHHTADGLILYHPWQGPGVAFNQLGLRTAMPTPKKPGEWRIAVTGGSAAWGWHVFDADTIPVQLQGILRATGHPNVTVYNFGIGGVSLKHELALLKKFRDVYGIDQVLFYTGGNDVFFSYTSAANKDYGAWVGAVQSFELVKLAARLQAMWSTPTPQAMQRFDNEVLPRALKISTFNKDIAAADEYCRAAKLRCDFALQPVMSERKTHSGAEAAMEKTLARVYPRLDVLAKRMYADAMAVGPPGHVFNLTHIFDNSTTPYFLDFVHLNEAGNRIAAENVAPIASAQLP